MVIVCSAARRRGLPSLSCEVFAVLRGASYELQSKLLKGGYLANYTGDYYGAYAVYLCPLRKRDDCYDHSYYHYYSMITVNLITVHVITIG